MLSTQRGDMSEQGVRDVDAALAQMTGGTVEIGGVHRMMAETMRLRPEARCSAASSSGPVNHFRTDHARVIGGAHLRPLQIS